MKSFCGFRWAVAARRGPPDPNATELCYWHPPAVAACRSDRSGYRTLPAVGLTTQSGWTRDAPLADPLRHQRLVLIVEDAVAVHVCALHCRRIRCPDPVRQCDDQE